MTPTPAAKAEARRAAGRAAALLFLALLATLSSSPGRAEPGSESYEIQARWRIGRGLLSAGGRLSLRELDDQRVSLRLDLPALGLLPSRQIVLRDGPALLHWAEPPTARSLLDAAPGLRELLGELAPGAWPALLSGRGLAVHLTAANWEDGVLQGRLAGGEARLRLRGDQARRLDWSGPAGRWVLHWRDGVRGRGSELRLTRGDGLKLRINSRMRRQGDVGEEDWLFLADSDTFREPVGR